MKGRPSEICVICGLQPATTDDHLPPKGVFPKPRPSDLITVRTCLKCNKSTSELDEIFKVFIGIASGHGPEGEKSFKDQTSRTLQHNRRLKREIASTVRDVWVKTPEGVILGKRPAVLLNSKAHDQIIEKTVRGLHFHQTGVIIGGDADIKVNWHYSLTRDMFDMSAGWPTGIVGDGQFIYKFLAPQEESLASVWIFESSAEHGPVERSFRKEQGWSAIPGTVHLIPAAMKKSLTFALKASARHRRRANLQGYQGRAPL